MPVLEYNGKKIGESLEISKLLEKEFPEPSVFKTNCQTGRVSQVFLLLQMAGQLLVQDPGDAVCCCML